MSSIRFFSLVLLSTFTMTPKVFGQSAQSEKIVVKNGIELSSGSSKNNEIIGVSVVNEEMTKTKGKQIEFNHIALGLQSNETTDASSTHFNVHASEGGLNLSAIRSPFYLGSELTAVLDVDIDPKQKKTLNQKSPDYNFYRAGFEVETGVLFENLGNQNNFLTFGVCMEALMQASWGDETEFDLIPLASIRARYVQLDDKKNSGLKCELKVGESLNTHEEGTMANLSVTKWVGPLNFEAGYQRDDFDGQQDDGRTYLSVGFSIGR